MAQTPFKDLGSVDILAGHVSGLQHAVNKLEAVLNMRTASVTDHVLTPVADQDDPNLRYRIYEGTIRNWLESPAPVIKRNGQVVSTSEYTVYPAYGVVVFHEQQPSNAQITADVTYITSQSEVLDWLTRYNPFAFQRIGMWRANNVGAGMQIALSVKPDALDCIPFPVPYTMSFDAIGIRVATGDTGAKVRLGVYADTGELYPGTLILDAGEVAADTAGPKILSINLTLPRGLYWLARVQTGSATLYGMASEAVLPIGMDDSLVDEPMTAWRVDAAYGPLPSTYPSGGTLRWGAMPAVWLRRSA